MKKFFIAAGAFVLLASFCSADNNPPVSRGQNELSFYSGPSVSVRETEINGQHVDYGGSGFALGITALSYVTDHIGAGVDISYSDNGYGGWKNVLGPEVRVAAEHFSPMFAAKIQFFPNSPLRLYMPLVAGPGFTKISVDQAGTGRKSDRVTSLSAGGGLGIEFDVATNIFIGCEARYTYMNFLGKDMAGVKDMGTVNILFKFGARFEGDFLM